MPGEDLTELRARNAAMKEQVDNLLDTFHRQTEALRDAQQEAAQVTATVTSTDGLVTATVDATGVLSALEISPSAFAKTTPEVLAREVLRLSRQGASKVRGQVSALMTPLTSGLPDLDDLFEDAPALKDLLPEIQVTAPVADDPLDDEDGAPDTWLRKRRS
ncbi:YbaB/EbfC family nucleoid-associated protein [Actinokineospora enzanensis]|uniref:YbaB/EbfC family nucleoid-associated protein n=1 Tax=Actinokineospora enzanensis TaxID=155975 RepID=UPI000382934D|nr:YbaB/EbfC family nucleoid-associated protein [Actinokineospora enzanensis]